MMKWTSNWTQYIIWSTERLDQREYWISMVASKRMEVIPYSNIDILWDINHHILLQQPVCLYRHTSPGRVSADAKKRVKKRYAKLLPSADDITYIPYVIYDS